MAGYIGSNISVAQAPEAEQKFRFIATAGQTVFTGLSYVPGNLHVFQNGVRLVENTDYTAQDQVSLTLTTGATVGDEIVVVALTRHFDIADAYTKAESDAQNVKILGDQEIAGKKKFTGHLVVPTIAPEFPENGSLWIE
jgi:hypothetical protein